MALEKVCPACGKDLPPTAVKCDNQSCPNPTAVATTSSCPKQRKPDAEGEAPRIQQQVTLLNNTPTNKMIVPGIPMQAQAVMPLAKTAPRPMAPMPMPRKPINQKKRLISDDDAQVVDEGHLSNCDHSADHLGL